MSNTPVYRQTISIMGPQDRSLLASGQHQHPQNYRVHPSPNQVSLSQGGSGTGDVLSQGFGRLAIATQPHSKKTINVLLCGEPGTGKSSVINLIARKNIAKVPSGAGGCTLQYSRHDISIDDMDVSIFEIAGLREPEFKGNGYLVALEKALEFVSKLSAAGGVHLLAFCMRRSRLTATTQNNYRLFSEVVLQKKVPIALVVTGLEGEADMEEWWTKNKTDVERYGLKSHGHACITTVSDRTLLQNNNYAESRKRIRGLLKHCSLKTPAFLPDPQDWFLRLGHGMQQFIGNYQETTRAEIETTLTARLKLDPTTVRRFLDMMGRGSAPQSGGSGASSLQHAPLVRVAHQDSKGMTDPPKSDSTWRPPESGSGRGGYELPKASFVETSRTGHGNDTGRGGYVPSRRRTTGEVRPVQYPLSSTEEEGTNRKSENGVQRREMGVGNVPPIAPQKVNTQTQTDSKSEMDMWMEEILRNFPRDLTGHVTRSEKDPFAKGSCGDIYRGKLRMHGKSIGVAIKVYKMYLQRNDSLYEGMMSRFHREITVWLKLQHQNVLPLFGTIRNDTYPHIPCMVCPWIEHGALSGYLDRNRNLTVTNRLTLIDNVAHGLQYLHAQGVVHGDLSGSNVLVDADGRARIADFGLATLLTAVGGQAFVTTRQDTGTLRWMAPELVLGHDGSHAAPIKESDVYSFGSIMLQILTGNIPYHRLSRDAQVIIAIKRGQRPDRSDHKAVSNERWKFIEKCWSTDGRARPSSDQIVEFTRRELSESKTRKEQA